MATISIQEIQSKPWISNLGPSYPQILAIPSSFLRSSNLRFRGNRMATTEISDQATTDHKQLSTTRHKSIGASAKPGVTMFLEHLR